MVIAMHSDRFGDYFQTNYIHK